MDNLISPSTIEWTPNFKYSTHEIIYVVIPHNSYAFSDWSSQNSLTLLAEKNSNSLGKQQLELSTPMWSARQANNIFAVMAATLSGVKWPYIWVVMYDKTVCTWCDGFYNHPCPSDWQNHINTAHENEKPLRVFDARKTRMENDGNWFIRHTQLIKLVIEEHKRCSKSAVGCLHFTTPVRSF